MSEVVNLLPHHRTRPLLERLSDARARHFVGRAEPLRKFHELIRADGTRRALYFHGLGGIGKSTLLDVFAQIGRDLGIPVQRYDLRDFPQAAGLADVLKTKPPQAPIWLLILDTCERLQGADKDLYQCWLPALPDSVRLVLAGRVRPSLEWRADPGWCEAMEVCPLEPLLEAESRELLAHLKVPPDRFDAALRCTHGHPLALTLLARNHDEGGELGEDDPEMLAVLLKRFLAAVPSEAHRQAVEICAHARVTTDSLLQRFFNAPQASALHTWLAAQPFVERTRDGLFPHDLVREVVDRDLRRRDPVRYREQHLRVSRHAIARSGQGMPMDLLFLHRGSPLLAHALAWNRTAPLSCEPARIDDLADICSCVQRHEGDASAMLASAWFGVQPEAFDVIRNPQGEFHGVLVRLRLNAGQLSAAPALTDPACIAASRWLSTTPRLRGQESLGLVRWWIAEGAYHAPGPGDDAMIGRLTVLWLGNQQVVADLVPHRRPDVWKAQSEYIDFHHLPEADYGIDGHDFRVFGHDWRVTPLADWLDGFQARRAEAARDVPRDAPQAFAPPDYSRLPRSEFQAHLHEALRMARDPQRLGTSPLCRWLDKQESGPGAAVADWLKAGLLELSKSPKQRRLADVLDISFFRDCPSQEVAAERLNLAFGTYRHRLRAAEAALEGILWLRLR